VGVFADTVNDQPLNADNQSLHKKHHAELLTGDFNSLCLLLGGKKAYIIGISIKFKEIQFSPQFMNGGTRWDSWLRHCVKSRQVAGSIPNCVTGVFH